MARSVFTQTNKMAIKINYKILSQLKNQLELVGSTVPSNCLVEVVKCGVPVSGGGNVVSCFLLLSTLSTVAGNNKHVSLPAACDAVGTLTISRHCKHLCCLPRDTQYLWDLQAVWNACRSYMGTHFTFYKDC